MRISIVLLFLSVLCRTAIAQEIPPAAPIKIGIEAGPNISRIINAYYSYTPNTGQIIPNNSDSRLGYSGGVFADIPVGDLFFFRPKLLFTTGGGKLPAIYDYTGAETAPSTKYTFNYLNLPLQFLYSPTWKFGRPWIGIGFYTSMMIDGKLNSTESSRALHLGGSSTDDYARWDFGFNPTVGLTLNNGFCFGVDYQIGMVKISNPPVGGYGPRLNTRNTVWNFHVGYEWTLK